VELIPNHAREIDSLVLRRNAGLEFALLTGDFNPVHWLSPYARALGHQGTILHGFASMAHLFESLKRALSAGTGETLRVFDARFLRPLVLPAALGVFLDGDRVFLGSRGQPAIVAASYSSVDAKKLAVDSLIGRDAWTATAAGTETRA
jgi:acyl dehydratase